MKTNRRWQKVLGSFVAVLALASCSGKRLTQGGCQSQTDCQGDPGDGCTWTCVDEQCVALCPECQTASDCQGSPGTGCEWTCTQENECEAECPECRLASDCTGDPGDGCAWTCTQDKTCEAECPECQIASDCTGDPGDGCRWTCSDEQTCQATCTECDTAADCQGDPGDGCEWTCTEDQRCLANCGECEDDGNCWTPEYEFCMPICTEEHRCVQKCEECPGVVGYTLERFGDPVQGNGWDEVANVFVIHHTWPDAPAVDVQVDGCVPLFCDQRGFEYFCEFILEPGAVDLSIRRHDDQQILAVLSGAEMQAGHRYVMMILGDPAEPVIELVEDADLTVPPPEGKDHIRFYNLRKSHEDMGFYTRAGSVHDEAGEINGMWIEDLPYGQASDIVELDAGLIADLAWFSVEEDEEGYSATFFWEWACDGEMSAQLGTQGKYSLMILEHSETSGNWMGFMFCFP